MVWRILLLVALGVSFFGSLLVAAWVFPAGYDWRQTVMSSLESPTENPGAFRVVSYGMACSGVLLAILGFSLRGALRVYGPGWTAWARVFFVLGGFLLTISALVTPGHHALLGLPKAHAKLAQAAGVGFALGMALNLPAILRTPAGDYRVRRVAVVLACLPMTVFLFCWSILPWVAVAMAPGVWRDDLRVAFFERLAFWEWVGAVSVYLFVGVVVLGWGEEGTILDRRNMRDRKGGG